MTLVLLKTAAHAQAVAAPNWIGGYALPPELGDWLGRTLQGIWPQLRWSQTTDASALHRWQVDLWLLTAPPPCVPARPLLWIRSPARGARWYPIAPQRWCIRAPVLASELRAAVRAILAQSQRSSGSGP